MRSWVLITEQLTPLEMTEFETESMLEEIAAWTLLLGLPLHKRDNLKTSKGTVSSIFWNERISFVHTTMNSTI